MLISKFTLDGRPVESLSPCSEKRVTLRCDTCGQDSATSFANYTRTQNKKGNTGDTQCLSCTRKNNGKLNKGLVPHNKGKKLPPELRGSGSPSWRGGRYIDASGYVMVHVMGDKTKIGWDAYRKEHILVVEHLIGRRITRGEVVHHIDGDKTNNKPENLWLSSHAGHRIAHQSLQEIGYELISSGLIVFDRESKKYKLV